MYSREYAKGSNEINWYEHAQKLVGTTLKTVPVIRRLFIPCVNNPQQWLFKQWYVDNLTSKRLPVIRRIEDENSL